MTETEKREEILATLQRNPDPEHLWECIIAFQDYHFETISGLPFTYQKKLFFDLWLLCHSNCHCGLPCVHCKA